MLNQIFNIVDDNDKNFSLRTNKNFMLTQSFNIVDDNDKNFLSS